MCLSNNVLKNTGFYSIYSIGNLVLLSFSLIAAK